MENLLKRLSGLSLSNKYLQIFSLVLAIICWYGIQSVNDSESTVYRTADSAELQNASRLSVNLPIGILVPTGDRAVKVKVEPETAELKFDRASPRTAKSAGETAIFVDCSDIASSGKYRLPVSSVSPRGVSVVDIQPASAIVQVEFID